MRLLPRPTSHKDTRRKPAFLKPAVSFYGAEAPSGLNRVGCAESEGGGVGHQGGRKLSGGRPFLITIHLDYGPQHLVFLVSLP